MQSKAILGGLSSRKTAKMRPGAKQSHSWGTVEQENRQNAIGCKAKPFLRDCMSGILSAKTFVSIKKPLLVSCRNDAAGARYSPALFRSY